MFLIWSVLLKAGNLWQQKLRASRLLLRPLCARSEENRNSSDACTNLTERPPILCGSACEDDQGFSLVLGLVSIFKRPEDPFLGGPAT